MAIYRGNTEFSKIYRGNTEIDKIYKGQNEVYTSAAMYTTNQILWLDAGNSTSYPGSGTVWTDLSGQGNNFNIVSTAYNSGATPYMDFNGSHGMAKNSSDISLSDSTGVTYFMITRIKNSTADWRTLTRSYVNDHHVIIQAGAWDIGMYDNDGGAFQDSGVDQTSVPGNGTSTWVALYWRWQSTSPYYQFSWNDTPGTIRGSITTTQSRYNRGFGALGGYHNGNTTPSSGSQYWGDIAVFAAYNSFLTDAQLLQNYNFYKTQYGL